MNTYFSRQEKILKKGIELDEWAKQLTDKAREGLKAS